MDFFRMTIGSGVGFFCIVSRKNALIPADVRQAMLSVFPFKFAFKRRQLFRAAGDFNEFIFYRVHHQAHPCFYQESFAEGGFVAVYHA